ncbi:hypothetical protein Pmar_PMAR016523 [Perkinsus marinus ATCC 50983]|uniref:Uncharacterized protein n=1 Tax=Perkinsus marinus (strain ATCC 50983 / TXsc) TaxID=423536 RepID=C5KEV2_PERM5|nr:hypothetical protein Pmar_PMAR016523 [Perkinsus marinus ATCC 50983]EER16993.1 hypothetical protein Pmar_PMAR016523 [Perkinsus marinus ATCC 50983]|eukprot:XP_002785197.1 hypothetical protein Pmar_PMAR016523 [Perkinsus marinus ATCC 50983]
MPVLNRDDNKAIEEALELRTINFYDLPNDGETSECKLIVRLLHTKAPEKVVRFQKFVGGQGGNQNKRIMAEQSYHRWLLCYDVLSGEPVVVITYSSSQSDDLLKFVGDLFPGSTAALIEPSTVGRLENGLKLLSSPDRLIPIAVDEVLTDIPRGIESSTRYRVYNFRVESVNLLRATVIEDCCFGPLCDAQGPPSKRCGCVATDPTKSKWVVQFVLETPTLNRSFTISSHQLTAYFVDDAATLETCQWSGLAIRPKIREILAYVNSLGGWVATAWVKPGRVAATADEQGAITESKLHVCSLRPSNTTPEVIENVKAMRLRRVVRNANDLNIRAAQIQGPQRQNVNQPNVAVQQVANQGNRDHIARQPVFRGLEPPAVRERRLAAEAAAAAAAAGSEASPENADRASSVDVADESLED